MIYLLAALALASLLYQFLAVAAAWRQCRSKQAPATRLPPVSILKPAHGLDPNFREALRSHALQEYPEYEILFGVSDPVDPAIPEIERLMEEFPRLPIRLVRCSTRAANQKVGVLAELAALARHDILVVNDSDIWVPPDYLCQIVAPLENPQVGLVTCLYRGNSRHRPGRWEALGIATDFAPSVLVAPLAGVSEFALGSTLAFRARHLSEIGGFAAIAGYLADDYHLGRLIKRLGLRVYLSRVVVETSLPGRTWVEVWQHQLRWHRTIRVSRPGGYLGMPITQASFWALLAGVSGLWWLAVPLLGARMAAGLLTGVGVLRCPLTARYFLVIPFRDLFGFAVWIAGLFGSTVEWRGIRLRLDPSGRIKPGTDPPFAE